LSGFALLADVDYAFFAGYRAAASWKEATAWMKAQGV